MIISQEKKVTIGQTFSHGLIYVYSVPGVSHEGRLKIGSTHTPVENPTQQDLIDAAHDRIKPDAQRMDVPYELEYVEKSISHNGEYFSDHEVHQVLLRSGFERKPKNYDNAKAEWFKVDLGTAKKAIKAVKEGRKALKNSEVVVDGAESFELRPNQKQAVKVTNEAIKKKKKHFLWNAKMRFGKTVAAMQVAKDNQFKKILIITHRPSVSTDWSEDFDKIFKGTEYQFCTKHLGEDARTHIENDVSFVYFVSLQDLRLSRGVVGDESVKSNSAGFEKNQEILENHWDMLIVDEAHEGTESDLGIATLEKVPAGFTLRLSGTPFNILHKHHESEIYTWDYVMEQSAKMEWGNENSGIPNPYADLPEISMFTYDIDKFSTDIGFGNGDFSDALDGAFKFHEFFRVLKDDEGNDLPQFKHEDMVMRFLDLLTNDQLKTKFPYATEEYRSYNKHVLWLLPNRVKVIEAMEILLNKHPVFGTFGIVNISGSPKKDDDLDVDAKKRVKKAIEKNDYTITLTGQRLTTGASIKQWTAVFMLSDTNSASSYLQTAFRCQTPARIDGKIKTKGYVFDFAPDRTLRLVAEAIEVNHKAGKMSSAVQKEKMAQFLNFCPILAASEGSMKAFDVNKMLERLKKAAIERVARNGFDDPRLYNDQLLELQEVDLNQFNDLKDIVGTQSSKPVGDVKVNEHGMDELSRKKAEEVEEKKKKKQALSEEEKEALKKLQEARKQKKTAIDILRAVSIRMPMLVYGAKIPIDKGVGINDFIDLVDPESWKEFMPEGLTKKKFRTFIKYYDEEVFRGVTRNIRAKAYDCDQLPPHERIQAIAEIFKTFKNPDKETVLTPWNVVNRHISSTLGGSDFRKMDDETDLSQWVDKGSPTKIWSDTNARVLEINSKSGLYPLLAAYNFYRELLSSEFNGEEGVYESLWSAVIENNIFVICKSPMARMITERTLAGYLGTKTNIVYIEDLVKKLQKVDKYKNYDLQTELKKKFNLSDMKFKAIVGNPPYQINTDTNFAKPVYHQFFDAAVRLDPDYVTLIHPARFLFNAGATPKEWNKKMLNDQHLSVPLYEARSQDIFESVDIKGGVCVTFWDKSQKQGGLGGSFVPYKELVSIMKKVGSGGFDQIVGPRGGTRAKQWQDSFNRSRSYFPSSVFSTNPELFQNIKTESYQVKLVGLVKNKRTEKYVSNDLIQDDNLSKWKVFIPKSNGSGAIGEMISTPLTGEPLTGCTESFIQIGSFEGMSEAVNCMNYIKTKFCRALLGTLKVTQDNPKNTWKNVPIQDFSRKSDIDWSKSISEIDQQLYKKYKLDKEEIAFIQENVRAMD